MKRLLLLAALLLLAPAIAEAQDETPEIEVFGGYSYLRADEDIHGIDDGGANLHGWEGSITYNLNDWFGVEADFGGHYGSDESTIIIQPAFDPLPGFPTVGFDFDVDSRQHTFLFGPRVAARGDRVTPFAHALFGGANLKRELVVTPVTPVPPGINGIAFESSETSFAMAVGGGVDIKLSDHVALRAVQADYVLTRFEEGRTVTPFGQLPGSDSQHNARISVGLVFRFGNR